MDLEKERLLAFMCAVLCKFRDAYRSVRGALPRHSVLYPCLHLYFVRGNVFYMEDFKPGFLSCTLLL